LYIGQQVGWDYDDRIMMELTGKGRACIPAGLTAT